MNGLAYCNNQFSSKYTLWMLCGYIFLFIDRPWESISYLRSIKIELIYAVLLILVAFLSRRLHLRSVPTDKWVISLLALHFILIPFAYIPSAAFDQAIEYSKLVIIYILMVSVCDDDIDLQLLIKVFVLSMVFYVLHSYWEFMNGRNEYRQGIVRMIGVGEKFNDPNAFGASIVLSFPFAWVLLKSSVLKWERRVVIFYFLLGIVCVVLTGSRSAFAALLLLLLLFVALQKGARRFVMLFICVILICLSWSVMPDDKKDRIRTMWDEEAGPKVAHDSAMGRSRGFHAGMQMFADRPITGVGAGGNNFIAYRVDKLDGIPEQAHNLTGEVLGEFGLLGGVAFIGLIASSFRLFLRVRKLSGDGTFNYLLAGAGLITLFLLIFLGFAGHNFNRPMWLWLAAWASILTITNKDTSMGYL